MAMLIVEEGLASNVFLGWIADVSKG